MPKKSGEFMAFDDAMTTILRADPKAVKATMEADKAARSVNRKRTPKLTKAQREASIAGFKKAEAAVKLKPHKDHWDRVNKKMKDDPNFQVPY